MILIFLFFTNKVNDYKQIDLIIIKKHKNYLLIIENIEINVKIIYNESNVIFIIVSINGKTLMMENKSNKLKGRRINLWRILSTMI